ncbi:MAG: glycosyltransferase family 4 protein [Akkermansiaceae bacterium]|nr:glycosyltransferase family 4 protein [Akkermansiaceae bacterium]
MNVLLPIRLDRAQSPIATLLREIAMRNAGVNFTSFSGPLTAEDERLAERLWGLPQVRRGGPPQMLLSRFDVVHTASATPRNRQAVQLAKLRSGGRTRHVHTANCEPHEGDPHLESYEAVVRRCDYLVAVSETVAAAVEDRWGRRADRVVPNGFDETYYDLPAPGRPRERTILFASAIIPRKHPELVLRLAELMPDASFVMVGSEPPEDREFSGPLRAEAERRPNIDFRGRVPRGELRDLMQTAAVLVFPSDYEGLPLTVVEAMGCGMPVVAQDASVLPEIIEDGVTGWLLPREPEDGWVARVREILAWDPARQREFAERARASVCARFPWDAIASAYGDIYREIARS